MTALLGLECGDDPAAWAALGFPVSPEGDVVVGTVTVRLDGRGGGLRGWTLAGHGGPADVDGIPTSWHAGGGGSGALVLDHVVVLTDDVGRTATAIVHAGGDLRRRAGPPAAPVDMAFVRLGPVVVEVATGGAPARLWGLVAVVDDLDGLAGRLGDRLGTVRDAVQPGRRIATARPAEGLETAIAFMTPRVRTR